MVEAFQQVFETPFPFDITYNNFYISIKVDTLLFHKLIDGYTGVKVYKKCTKLKLEKIKETLDLLKQTW